MLSVIQHVSEPLNWNIIIPAFIVVVPGILGSIVSLRNGKKLKTSNGKNVGKYVEETNRAQIAHGKDLEVVKTALINLTANVEEAKQEVAEGKAEAAAALALHTESDAKNFDQMIHMAEANREYIGELLTTLIYNFGDEKKDLPIPPKPPTM